MIPFGDHPIVRAGISMFFTAGLTYATYGAAVERRWEDMLFLAPLLLLASLGHIVSLLALREWHRQNS